nr:hypothetical protein [Tanacetum cinerariifolium]
MLMDQVDLVNPEGHRLVPDVSKPLPLGGPPGQYLQHEHYALWEVIEFDDSYKVPPEKTTKDKGLAGEVSSSTKKKGRTVVVTAEDMQKRKNDFKARTTLLLALPDEYQNEATKKTKKNQLKQQYGNFKSEGSETLEQTFNRLQAIVSHLEFMDVPIEKDDLNQKFLTSLAPEWLVYTIVWRNRYNLDTMSLDDMYNHLKVYKTEIYDDDIEEMDIKWNLALLSMRADRFWKKIESADPQRVETEGRKRAIRRMLRNELEEVKTEEESIDFKIEKFENASKDIDRFLGSQKLDKDMKGVGFNKYYVVPPPPAQVYSPPKEDLSWMGLPEFVDVEIKKLLRSLSSRWVRSHLGLQNIKDK